MWRHYVEQSQISTLCSSKLTFLCVEPVRLSCSPQTCGSLVLLVFDEVMTSSFFLSQRLFPVEPDAAEVNMWVCSHYHVPCLFLGVGSHFFWHCLLLGNLPWLCSFDVFVGLSLAWVHPKANLNIYLWVCRQDLGSKSLCGCLRGSVTLTFRTSLPIPEKIQWAKKEPNPACTCCAQYAKYKAKFKSDKVFAVQ